MASAIRSVRDRSTFAELSLSKSRAKLESIAVTRVIRPESKDPGAYVAYAIGKRVGTSVVRNKIRRRLRAIMAEISEELAPGAYLVSVGSVINEMEYQDMRANVHNALQRLGALGAVEPVSVDGASKDMVPR